jgi:GTP-binding protein
LSNGNLKLNEQYTLCGEKENVSPVKFSALYTFRGLEKTKVEAVEAGDIIAVAGIDNVNIGDTISSFENPIPLPRIYVDEPTVSMIFYVNNGPFAGTEGKYLTSRNLSGRLQQETLKNVSLRVSNYEDRTDAFEVAGRGELQMAVLIETMRREGYEFMVSKPQVIIKEIDGVKCEPVERVFIDLPEDHAGTITERLQLRKGIMVNFVNNGFGRVDLEFLIPSRGLIGFRSQFLTETKGAGIMNTLFEDYQPWFGVIPQRKNGGIVADRAGKVTAYACLGMEDRGELFVEVGTNVYMGMIVGERNKQEDLNVNITKEKKLTNMRASSSDQTVVLKTPRKMSLDEAIEFIAEDELVEVTPLNIRLRKAKLDPHDRKVKTKI